MAIDYQTSVVKTENIGKTVDELMQHAYNARRPFERKLYDNQFFDDGYHFRYWSRTARKVVDVSNDTSIYSPMRAIPKASKQIRGVANLLTTNDPVPTVYPENINEGAFENPEEFKKAKEINNRTAKLIGHWISEEFKNQEITEQLALMLILAAKHGISFMQIWPDAVKEKIRTQVYDAFDIYLEGTYQSIYDSPYLIKGIPKIIAKIKANELFNKDQLSKITPDNRLASSEIKAAYMKARSGVTDNPDAVATITLKEAFLKEYVGENNKARIRQMNPDLLEYRNDGDCVIRHAFVAGDIWLYDEYLDVYEYPFVDFRFEPGPIYQVPLIERFIPQNKSLDVVVSRIERYINTMVTGFWMKKQGEQFKPTNVAGGVVYEYLSTPPTQGNISPVPGFVFSFMDLLTNYIEEQGVTTTTLSKIPKGVRSNAAIESLKESEYASLAIAQRRFKQTVKHIAEKFLMIADDYFIKPKQVRFLEKGEPQYFDVIGKKAKEAREKLGVPVKDDIILLSSESHVDIEVEAGLGFTKTGKREAMLKLVSEIFLPLAEKGFIPPQAVQTIVEKVAETYQFGATAELMSAFDSDKPQFTERQQQELEQTIMTAVAQVFKDLQGSEMFPDEQKRVDEGKMATAEALRDTGMIDGKPQDPMMQKEIEAKDQEMQQKAEKHQLEMQKIRQDLGLKEEKVDTELSIKRAEARQDMEIKGEESEAKIEVQKKVATIHAKQPKEAKSAVPQRKAT